MLKYCVAMLTASSLEEHEERADVLSRLSLPTSWRDAARLKKINIQKFKKVH